MKKEENIIEYTTRIYADQWAKIWKRCALEGCRYGYEGIDKVVKDACIYCGESRNQYFDTDGPLLSIRKSLKKYKPRVLK